MCLDDNRCDQLRSPISLLDTQQIGAQLAPNVRSQLAGLSVVWSVDSTNTRLLQSAASAKKQVLLAEQQTAGRGRRGHRWFSPPATNLYLSLATTLPGGLAQSSGLGLVTSIAAAETLQQMGLSHIKVKWPNDLTVHGHKLGGILIETDHPAPKMVRAVIGLGINVAMSHIQAADITQPWTDLVTQLKKPIDRNQLAAKILNTLIPAIGSYENTGFSPLRRRYAALDCLLGRQIILEQQGERQIGIADGLSQDGGLNVLIAGSRHTFHSGQVSVRTL